LPTDHAPSARPIPRSDRDEVKSRSPARRYCSVPCSRSRPGARSLLPMPTPRNALQCERHEGVFAPGVGSPRAGSLSRRPAALARRVGRMVAGHSRKLWAARARLFRGPAQGRRSA